MQSRGGVIGAPGSCRRHEAPSEVTAGASSLSSRCGSAVVVSSQETLASWLADGEVSDLGEGWQRPWGELTVVAGSFHFRQSPQAS